MELVSTMQYIVLRHTYVLYTKLLRKGLLLEPPRSLGFSGPIPPVCECPLSLLVNASPATEGVDAQGEVYHQYPLSRNLSGAIWDRISVIHKIFPTKPGLGPENGPSKLNN